MPHKKSEEGWLSVTEVLSLTIDKPFLRYWYGKEGTQKCEQIKRESQEIGIEVHRLIEERFKGNQWSDTPTLMIDRFWNRFVIPYEVKPIALEVTMKDEKLKLQGTFDALIECSKGIYLMDWKTSNSIDKVSVPLQLSAYQHLSKETDCVGGGIVRIDKESNKIEVKWYEDLEQYWPYFKAALKLARFIKFGIEE